nr:CdaR family protein [uncultured Anaerostipes sp.]
MKEKIGNNLLLKIVSVVFAFLLWVFVINVDNPVIKKTFSDVPVDIINEQVLDDLNQIYKIDEGETVSFTVRGKKDIIDQLKKSDFQATADLSSMSDVHAVPIKVEALRYKEQLDIDTDNATVKITLEDLKSDQIPVTVKITGKPAKGYAVSDETATPNLVSVSGPKSVIAQIDEIVATVDVTGLKKDVTMTQNVKCYDSDGEEINQDRITLDTTKIKVQIHLSKTKTVKLAVKTKGKPASGYTLGSIDCKPKEIEITGNSDDLEAIDEIELATLDIGDSTKSVEKTIKASDVDLPDGIRFVEDAGDIGNFVIRANIEKEKEKTMEIPVNQITLENNTKNYDVEFKEETIEVKIIGLESVVDKVVVKDLNPKIDMSLYETGTHTVQVQLEKIANMTIDGNVSATITIK